MNPSFLATPPHNPSLCFFPFLNPIRNTISLSTSRRSRYLPHFIVSLIHNSTSTSQNPTSSNLFGPKKELNGLQRLVYGMGLSARLETSVLIVADALAAGYGLGNLFGRTRSLATGGALALGAVSGVPVYALNSCVPEVAGSDDTVAISKKDIEGIAKKYAYAIST